MYVNNNPINFNDPSGHGPCDEEGNCYNKNGWYSDRGYHFGVNAIWKKLIKSNFGITMSDTGAKKWGNGNLQLMFNSLSLINDTLNGNVRSMVRGATFTLQDQEAGGEYHGLTHISRSEPTGIDFYAKGSQFLHQMNIFHEIGHLLDNAPGTWDVFMNHMGRDGLPFIQDNIISKEALSDLTIYNDPNYNRVQARQTYSNEGPREQWADDIGNYMAGNINLPTNEGQSMFNFVRAALQPHVGFLPPTMP